MIAVIKSLHKGIFGVRKPDRLLKPLASLARVAVVFIIMVAVYEAGCFIRSAERWMDAALLMDDPTHPPAN